MLKRELMSKYQKEADRLTSVANFSRDKIQECCDEFKEWENDAGGIHKLQQSISQWAKVAQEAEAKASIYKEVIEDLKNLEGEQ